MDAVSRDRGLELERTELTVRFPKAERGNGRWVWERFGGKEASRWRGRHCVEAASAATTRGRFFAAPRRHVVLVLASLCVAFQGVRDLDLDLDLYALGD